VQPGDGYGDYVRHYLRAMASMPELAPADKNRFLSSTSIVSSMVYKPEEITYTTFSPATDILRLKQKPVKITSDGKQLKESADKEGFTTKKLQNGFVLSINHGGKNIVINFR